MSSTAHPTLQAMIKNHPFMAGMEPHFIHHFNESASFERYGVGQEIFREGQVADRFYLIHSGNIALETFAPGLGTVQIQTLGPGEPLGWSWLFPPHVWHFTARAVDPSELIAFAVKGLRDEAEENPAFRADLVTRVAQILLSRLQATRLQLLDFYAKRW